MEQIAQTPFEKLLTQVIKTNIVIFGPTVVFAKLKHIPAVSVDNEGNVIRTQGGTHETIQLFITEFMQLSSFIAKKTLQPLIDFDAQEKK